MDRMQFKVQEGTGPNFVPAMVDAFRPEYMPQRKSGTLMKASR
jgi:hypothetical protein